MSARKEGPLLSYYGGKYRAAPKYGPPKFDTVIEPFAGGAGYSLRFGLDKRVILIEKEPRLAAMWAWLVRAPAAEILALPVLEPEQDVQQLELRPEAKTFIGFSLNSGVAAPCRVLSSWSWKFNRGNATAWGPERRARSARMVERLRAWEVVSGSYELSPDIEATWFVDPPYRGRAGSFYPCGSRELDYAALGAWCRSRRGQVIVCEAEGADWMPFRVFGAAQATPGKHRKGTSAEVVWLSEEQECRR